MRSPFALFALWLLASWPTPAHAYCVATTARSRKCGEPCPTTGAPLAFRDADIPYSFRTRGLGEVDDPTMRAVFAQAFQSWAEVQCDGRPIGFRFHAQDELTDLTIGPQPLEPNANVIWLPTLDEWNALYDGVDEREAYAITATWYDVSGPTPGRIRGADMTFSPRQGPWKVCAGECGGGNDLLNVATHEVGHVLGLAHSDAAGSTMWCDAREGDTEKRSLEADDVAGLCVAYEGITLRRKRSPQHCAFVPVASGSLGSSPWSAFVLAMVAWRVVRRARGARRHTQEIR